MMTLDALICALLEHRKVLSGDTPVGILRPSQFYRPPEIERALIYRTDDGDLIDYDYDDTGTQIGVVTL